MTKKSITTHNPLLAIDPRASQSHRVGIIKSS